MQVSASIEISRGEDVIQVDATGLFELVGSYDYNQRGLSLSAMSVEGDVELTLDEREALIDRLYDEARS